MRSIDLLISRIPRVKKTGRDCWRGCCPGHGGDNPSMLSIRETSDGRILLHCFKGCSVESILGTIGLEITDLFPERINDILRPERIRFNPIDLLKSIRLEARIICLAAFYVRGGKSISAQDMSRVEIAMNRINEVLEMIHGD